MNTIALVTLYNPDEKINERIKLLSEQVSSIFLLDNSPCLQCGDLFSAIKNCTYLSFGENLGLSAAFNRVLKCFSVCRTSDFILFFDQDSCITEQFIDTLVRDFISLSMLYKVGCLGPEYFDKIRGIRSGITKRNTPVGNGCFRSKEIITSSMITTYQVLEDIGFWDESVFLDYADFELCWRMAKYGYKVFITGNATLNHSLGVGTLQCHFLFKKMTFNYSSPIREYYQTRAAMTLLKRNYVPLNWKRNFMFNLTVRILLHTLYLPEKLKRLKYFCLGFAHGILGKKKHLNQHTGVSIPQHE